MIEEDFDDLVSMSLEKASSILEGNVKLWCSLGHCKEMRRILKREGKE